MERPEYALGGEVQRLVSQDPQEPQGFYPVTQVEIQEMKYNSLAPARRLFGRKALQLVLHPLYALCAS